MVWHVPRNTLINPKHVCSITRRIRYTWIFVAPPPSMASPSIKKFLVRWRCSQHIFADLMSIAGILSKGMNGGLTIPDTATATLHDLIEEILLVSLSLAQRFL